MANNKNIFSYSLTNFSALQMPHSFAPSTSSTSPPFLPNCQSINSNTSPHAFNQNNGNLCNTNDTTETTKKQNNDLLIQVKLIFIKRINFLNIKNSNLVDP